MSQEPELTRHRPAHVPMDDGPPSLGENTLLASICLESFEEFVREFWDQVPGAEPLKWNWHMGVICQELQEVAERVFCGLPREHDLVINISPGTSKSSLCSILFPAWVWARMPSARILTASHADDLVLDLANKARHVIKGEKYTSCFPHVQIRDDQDTKGYYATTRGGDRKTATVGGKSPIGFHGIFLIVDDPLDTKKAVSDAEIQTAAEFMTGVLPSRKVDKEVAVTVLIQQRLNRGDPTGVMLEKAKNPDAPKVRQVCLPCSLEFPVFPEELKGQYTDGLMDTVRLSTKVLKEQRALLGEYIFSAQYGQSPRAANAGMFEEHYFNRRVKAAPYDTKRIRYWDRAATQDGGCLTAGVLMARDAEGHFFVEHVVAGQWDTKNRNNQMRATALRDRARYGPNFEPIIYTEREGGSAGKDAWREVARTLAGFVVREDRPTGDKVTRAEPWSSQCAAGNVSLVEDGTWDINAYVQEHCLFPDGTFRDRVDASTGAFNLLVGWKRVATLHTLPLKRKDRKAKLRLTVTTGQDLPKLELKGKEVVVRLGDPDMEVLPVEDGFRSRVLAALDLVFADLDPRDYQERWEDPLPDGNLPSQVMMTRDHGKKFWAALTKKYSRPVEEVILVEDGGGRAVSLALALAEVLRLPPEQIEYSGPGGDSLTGKDPPNRHVYDTAKASRGMVL